MRHYQDFSKKGWPEFAFSAKVTDTHVEVWSNGNACVILRDRFDMLVRWYTIEVLARSKRDFVAKFGTERELLAKTNELISEMEVS